MVRPKKHLGQHFLKDAAVAGQIAATLKGGNYNKILEIGPGMGILTQFLLKREEELFVVEIDDESVNYLQKEFSALKNHIIPADFLKMDISLLFPGGVAITGNFPYNISSQILFKVLEYRNYVPEFTGMFQKEVAERIVAVEGSKTYGILSVLTAVYYDREYLFSVGPELFNPPPRVQSGVIRLIRKETVPAELDEKLFRQIVKAAFNQRRKTLRNALKSLNLNLSILGEDVLSKRAEQISPERFLDITYKMQQP